MDDRVEAEEELVWMEEAVDWRDGVDEDAVEGPEGWRLVELVVERYLGLLFSTWLADAPVVSSSSLSWLSSSSSSWSSSSGHPVPSSLYRSHNSSISAKLNGLLCSNVAERLSKQYKQCAIDAM